MINKYLRIISFLVSSVFLITNLQGQVTIRLNGIVIDSISNNPIEFCNVVFTDINNQIKKGCITNSKGIFAVDLPVGYSYLMEVSNIEYITFVNKFDLKVDSETINEFEAFSEKIVIKDII